MRGAISKKRGSQPRWPEEVEGMETSKRARRRKLDTAKTDLKPPLVLASLSLRESCLHEMCTGSLGGGRRPARKRASSDPRILGLDSFAIRLSTPLSSAGLSVSDPK